MSCKCVYIGYIRGAHTFFHLSYYYFYALTVEKQQIYKLTSRHRVPRCELVDLLFLSTLEAMEGADRTLLMSINQVIFIQVTDAKMRASVISVYKYFPL